MAGAPTLRDLANKYGSDKGDRHRFKHDYTALYDPLFFPRRLDHIRVLEIGLAIGGPDGGGPVERATSAPSIAMWLEYFPNAEIYGFDISDFSHLRHPRFRFVRGDLGSLEDLTRLAEAAPGYDIIIDDGSHASYHQQLALNHLFGRVTPGGLYVIEDLHWQSPVYEASLPAVPKTADLLHDALIAGNPVGSAALSAERLHAIAANLASCGLFPSFNGDGFARKMAVLAAQSRWRAAKHHRARRCAASICSIRWRLDVATNQSRCFVRWSTVRAARGFAACRHAAEARLYGTPYTLADIYQQLALDTGLQPDDANRLMNLELEIEREMLFPIAETCASFRPGDIVVSDMYLPPVFLQDLVQRVCGLPAARALCLGGRQEDTADLVRHRPGFQRDGAPGR